MTTPDVPHRLEFSVQVPGTPEQVWDAIATSEGLAAWFLPTDVEGREGGAIVTHMGETDSPGTVTGWEPPRRFAYVEPEWASLAGREDAPVTPLATEFLVEAQDGGTCLVRVVSSAFGTGADWEREFFADVERHWKPFFENLRLYLTHFPGQRATLLDASASVPGSAAELWPGIPKALGATDRGQQVEVRDLSGEVERLGQQELLVRVTAPIPGLLGLYAYDAGEGSAMVNVHGYLFSPAAPEYVGRETDRWREWLHGLVIPAA